MTGEVSVFRNRNLRPLVLASLPADLADWLDYVAIVTLLTFYWQAGPWALAWFAVALGAPHFFIGPFAGVLVDRLPLKPVLIWTNLGRAAATAAMMLAPDPILLLLLLAVRTSVDSAFTPARQAVLRALARPDELTAANSYIFGISQLSKITGPALSGALLLIMNVQMIFAVNACLSVLAALILLRLKIEQETVKRAAPERLFAGFVQGLRDMRTRPVLALAIFYFAAGFFAIFLYDTYIALYLETLGTDASFFALTMSVVGLGGVIGALVLARFDLKTGGSFVLMSVSGLISGAFAVFFWVLPRLAISATESLLLALFFGFGLLMTFAQVPYRTIVQREAPENRIGRIVALGEAVSVAALLSAPFIGGVLIVWFEVTLPFLVGGALMAFASLTTLFLYRRIR